MSLFSHKANDGGLASSLQNEQLRSNIILSSIADGVILVDGDGVIQLFNPGAVKITGWPADEATGLDWRLVFKFVDSKGQTVDETLTSMAKVFTAGETIRDNTANIMTKSGKSIALNISVTPLIDANNQVTGAVGIFRDVSEERREESQRAEFISTASHEMRTPVAAIEGYLYLKEDARASEAVVWRDWI